MNITTVSLKPMQASIAKPDAEPYQVKIPRITNLRLKNVQVDGSTRFLQEVTEEQKQNSPETDPNDTEHMRLFDKILEFHSFLGLLMGMKMKFEWNWNRHFGFWMVVFLAMSAWICMLNTMYMHYVNGKFVRILEPLATASYILAATHTICVWLKYHDAMVALTLNIKYVCRRTLEGCSRSNVLKSGFSKTLKQCKAFTFGLFFSTFLYYFMPVKVFLINKELMSLVPVEVLFCDQSKVLGFFVANVVLSIMGLYTIITITVFGLTFIIIINSYNLVVELIAEDLKDLDKMWTDSINCSVADRHELLRNICRKRQDMNRYLNMTKKIYEPTILFFFCTKYFGQIICLYQMTMNGWQGGYGAFFVSMVEMMFYCYMGSSISISDDRLCSIIYDTHWYEYDLMSQRIILLLLKEAQRTRELKLGFIGPLNMITFITVFKSIYSYYTVLTEML